MSCLNSSFSEYLNYKVEDVVKSSVLNSKDIDFDSYNDQGCNGYVFFGEHKIFRKRVAVKYYYFGENSHEEVRLLKNIKHKNILNIWDASTVNEGWACFITDEICQGTIDDYLKHNNLSLVESLKITKDILIGLSELHRPENKLLHRDIKPANILLERSFTPVIADFGSIKRIEEGLNFVNPSKNSFLYKPPESIIDNKYTVQSDIYQVGIVMFQVFGGSLPYDYLNYLNKKNILKYNKLGSSFDKSKFIDSILEEKICNGKLIDLATLPYFVDHRIKKIIRKATSPCQDKRYSDTSDFLLDLHELGTIPEWREIDSENFICSFKGVEYRVRKSYKGFAFEKKQIKKHGEKFPALIIS